MVTTFYTRGGQHPPLILLLLSLPPVVVVSGWDSGPCEACGRQRGGGGAGGCSCCQGGRRAPSSSSGDAPPPLNGHLPPPPPSQLIKVVVLGATGVGKTAIIKQFVHNEFPASHQPTRGRANHWPSVLVNDRVYQLCIADLPPIRAFPQNSFTEWADYRFYGLRSAMAYVFVFDLTCYESFTHIKALRDQVYESRDMREVGVVVVGNKRDLVEATEAREKREIRDVPAIVRKQWKAAYVEVSAKCNWHVVAAFRELLLAVEDAQAHTHARPHNLHELHEAIEHSKCTIL
ncbi:ras-like protein family member 10B [Procambarus clarkii]|uniref:ras-like protein family member 10B n=1 Tax=Procambarus clarkii TaxID=6728 RepID=UPI001E67103C|nr:ras-like protein family member 10B [Procambarus clarkii]XP_045606382.1 ras-like protein family member 10B [Procambarus clarkii]